jgi:type IV pilus assembly protein PilC
VARTYSYRVRDRQGKIISGKLEADSEQAVSQKLREMGYFVIGVEEERVPIAKKEIRILQPKVKPKDITVFTRQFATMINAGLPLVKCLSILAEQTESPVLTEVITDVQHEVEMGRSLSEALSKHPKMFKDLYTSMVRAGEIGGVLDDVLLRIATTLESEDEIRRRIKSAMTYPVAMFAISILLLFVMLIFVVPIFEKMFRDMGATLPFLTRIIVGISHFLASWKGALLLVALIVGFVFLRRWLKTPAGRRKLDALKLKLPIFGSLFHKMSLSRFSRTLGTLVASGVPILQALEITSNTVGNMLVAEAVDNVRAGVKEGESIAGPLKQCSVFPAMVVRMIDIGERTGALDDMLIKIADYYEEQVDIAVQGLTSLMEPLIICFLGVVVGGIVICMFLPMFQLGSIVGH